MKAVVSGPGEIRMREARPIAEGVMVETDVIGEFVGNPDTAILGKVLLAVPCYTTVVNAGEVLASAESVAEVERAMDALNRLRVLGMSSKYALEMGSIGRRAREKGVELSTRVLMIAGTTVASRLPLLTREFAALYRSIEGIRVVTEPEIAALVVGSDRIS